MSAMDAKMREKYDKFSEKMEERRRRSLGGTSFKFRRRKRTVSETSGTGSLSKSSDF